ncbi:hypothetical protein D1872_333910 [compost metagenome]
MPVRLGGMSGNIFAILEKSGGRLLWAVAVIGTEAVDILMLQIDIIFQSRMQRMQLFIYALCGQFSDKGIAVA